MQPEPHAAHDAQRTSKMRAFVEKARASLALVAHGPYDPSTADGRANERYRRAALGSATNLAAHVVAACTGLIAMPLTIGYLGKEQYGLWAAINALMTWAAIADFGLGRGIQNALGDAFGKDDWALARRYVGTGLAVLLGIAAALAIVGMPVVAYVPWNDILNVKDPALAVQTRFVVAAVGAVFLAGFPLSIGQTLYFAGQRAHVWQLFQIFGSFFYLGPLFLATHAHCSLPMLVVVTGGARILIQLAILTFAFVTMPNVRPRFADISTSTARSLSTIAAPMLFLQLGSLIINQLQPITIARTVGLGLVADYSVWNQVYALPVAIVLMLDTPIIPAFRESFARGDHAWFREAFRKLQRMKMALSAGSLVFFVIFGNFVAGLLSHHTVTLPMSVWVSSSLLLLVGVWNVSYNDLLIATDRSWTVVRVLFANGICTATLVALTAKPFGMLGVILSSAFFSTAFGTWIMPRLCKEFLEADKR